MHKESFSVLQQLSCPYRMMVDAETKVESGELTFASLRLCAFALNFFKRRSNP
jgi:hypothetical protein